MTTALPQLSVADIIDVQVNLTPASAQAQNLSTLLFLDVSNVIDQLERWRLYTDVDQVILDFSTVNNDSGVAVAAATAYFSQVPKPQQLIIGRWMKGQAAGGLRGNPGVAQTHGIATWQAITAGAFTYTLNGGSPTTVSGLNFSAVSDFNGVATVIDNALSGADCTYNASFDRIEFLSKTLGATSSVSFLTTPGSGTDISGLLLCQGGSNSAAYIFQGSATESAASVIATFDSLIGRKWYAVACTSATDSHNLQFSAYVEASRNKHAYVASTSDANALLANDTTSYLYQCRQLKYKKTFVQYALTGSTGAATCAISGFTRLLTTDYDGENTTITLMFKNEPGIAPQNINETQAAVLKSKGGNVFAQYDDDTSILQYGMMTSGDFADTVHGCDWLATSIETDEYNLLYTSLTKLPQTDAGSHLAVVTAEARLSQGVRNGLLAPGVYNAQGFGQLKQGDYLPKGFYAYVQPMALQNQSDRALRLMPPLQIAAKLAGAIHAMQITVNVNQ